MNTIILSLSRYIYFVYAYIPLHVFDTCTCLKQCYMRNEHGGAVVLDILDIYTFMHTSWYIWYMYIFRNRGQRGINTDMQYSSIYLIIVYVYIPFMSTIHVCIWNSAICGMNTVWNISLCILDVFICMHTSLCISYMRTFEWVWNERGILSIFLYICDLCTCMHIETYHIYREILRICAYVRHANVYMNTYVQICIYKHKYIRHTFICISIYSCIHIHIYVYILIYN